MRTRYAMMAASSAMGLTPTQKDAQTGQVHEHKGQDARPVDVIRRVLALCGHITAATVEPAHEAARQTGQQAPRRRPWGRYGGWRDHVPNNPLICSIGCTTQGRNAL